MIALLVKKDIVSVNLIDKFFLMIFRIFNIYSFHYLYYFYQISEFIFTSDEKKKSYNETMLQQYIDKTILFISLASIGFSCWALN